MLFLHQTTKKRTFHTDVLVIVPTYGHFDFARRCVDSLFQYPSTEGHRTQYCLIDDASSDWRTVDWSVWTNKPVICHHFRQHDGLSRSWNMGLSFAKDIGAKYAVCANSDILFSPGWLEPLIDALEDGYSLAGPLCNAPGHATWQNVRPFCSAHTNVRIDDSEESRQAISSALLSAKIGPFEAPLNGFLLAASVDAWWRGAFDSVNVFNPSFPLKHNEVELQSRWHKLGMRSAVVPRSYVFHYRSVSRPDGLVGSLAFGAMRPLRTGKN